jgi:hypothetical protein
MSEQSLGEQSMREDPAMEDGEALAPQSKLKQVMESRKAWAGVLGLVTTLTLWWVGEIDGARAVEAMTWVLGIFIGSVALEDGMARLFASLAGGMKGDVVKGQQSIGDD